MAENEIPKVVLLGDHLVGKTSIFTFLQKQPFSAYVNTTVGGGCALVDVQVGGQPVKLVLWDTAGEEKYRAIVPMYLRDVSYLLLVFDISNRESFDSVPGWAAFIRLHAKVSAKIVLIGNKADLEERVISMEDGFEMKEQIEAFEFMEGSVKNGVGIQEIIEKVAEDVMRSGSGSATRNDDAPFESKKLSQKSRKCC
jgi:small GTP-binding protein